MRINKKMKDNKDREPKTYYHISSVSRMFNVHPQTLRLYEREGLLKPSRSEGNTRLYTEDDIKQLRIILNLTRDLGINLAGVEAILNMRQRMEQIEAEVNMLLEYVKKEFFEGREDEFEIKREDLVHIRPTKIIKIKKESSEE